MKPNATLAPLFGLWAATTSVLNTTVDAPFGYKAGSPQSVANLKDKIKHVVWVLLENRSFDNILGAVNHPGLDNIANNGDFCIPQNVSDPNSPTFCTRIRDFDSVLNDPDHSVTGNAFEFYGQFSPDNALIADGTLTPHNLGFVEKQLISYPKITPQTAAEQILGYYSEDEIPTLVDLVTEFTTFNYWFSCIPGVRPIFPTSIFNPSFLLAHRSKPIVRYSRYIRRTWS